MRKYAQSLTKDDKGLIRFLEHFLATVQSSGISDYVPEISWRMNLNKVGDFLDLDDVDERLRKIQENPKYNELGEKEKRTIDTFLNTRDG